MNGYADQDVAADDVSGAEYEGMLDEGYTPPEREPNTARWDNEHETLDDRLAEEVPDDVPGSAYGNPDAQPAADDLYDAARVGRLEAPDEGVREDTDGELVAQDAGYAGGASSAEEAAMHVDDGLDQQGFDAGLDDGVDGLGDRSGA